MTFLFTLIYLIIRYDTALKKVDRIVKGLCAAVTLTACYSLSAIEGASLNPAFGLTQSLYMIGTKNREVENSGNDVA